MISVRKINDLIRNVLDFSTFFNHYLIMLDRSDKEFIKNEITEAVETAIGQISSAIGKVIENMATKSDLAELKTELKSDLSEVKSDTRDIKRRLTDLETDAPSNSEFQGHEKRIRKLEQTVLTA